jgi:hypothetical protein
VRRNVVHDLVMMETPSIVCLQATKLNVCSDYDVILILGHGFDYFYLQADHTGGGILLPWCSSAWSMASRSSKSYSVSTRMRSIAIGTGWWLTTVYGPTRDANKPSFIEELCQLMLIRSGP